MIGSSLPTITCVTVTKDRFQLLKRSIDCYIQQSYQNKNMVIVSQSNEEENQRIRDHLASISRDDIVLFVTREDMCLGSMRNLSVELATGDIICQWDDDDLYHPDRLMLQYNVLRSDNRRVASLYCDFLKYYEITGELYWCDWSGEPLLTHRFLCGSVMFYKRAFGMFREFYPESGTQSRVEEDLNVLDKLQTIGDLGPVWGGWHYTYVYHGENVYDLEHHNLTLDTSWGKKVLSADQLLERRVLIEDALRFGRVTREVRVRSKEELAFTFQP